MEQKNVSTESYFLPEKRYRLFPNSAVLQGIIVSFVFVFKDYIEEFI
jgi:hypothetical protein